MLRHHTRNVRGNLKMNIELTEIVRIKNHLLLKFKGICGRGSEGNADADFIIQKTKNELEKDNPISSLNP